MEWTKWRSILTYVEAVDETTNKGKSKEMQNTQVPSTPKVQGSALQDAQQGSSPAVGTPECDAMILKTAKYLKQKLVKFGHNAAVAML